MSEISSDLKAAIQAGDCVLWTGAGIGAPAGRSGWAEALGEQVRESSADEATQAELEALIEAGELASVLAWLRRHEGAEAIEAAVGPRPITDDDEEPPEAIAKLGALPWRACLATAHADLLARACAAHDRALANGPSGDGLGLPVDGEPFLRPTTPSVDLRDDHDLRELVEEAARTRTLLLLGFELGDPDLEQITAILRKAARTSGRPHYLYVTKIGAAQAERFEAEYGLIAAPLPEGGVEALLDQLAEACGDEAGDESHVSQAGDRLAALELARVLRPVTLRVDLGVDAAFCVDPHDVDRLVAQLAGGLESLPKRDLLRLGGVWLAHRRTGDLERARKAFQLAVSGSDTDERVARLARFNLALLALLEGDEEAARTGLEAAAEQDHNLALLPARFAVETVRGRVGSRIWFEGRDRSADDELVAVEVGVLGRPVSARERAHFGERVDALAAIDHPAMVRVRGSVSEGRIFGVVMDPEQGVPLSRLLAETDEPLALDKAFEIIGPLMEVVAVAHQKGVVHRNLHPRHVLITKAGAKLRGFGFLPLVSWSRPAIVRENYGYGAPELLAGGAPTPASDTYALAAMLYRCLTGRRPLGAVPPPSQLIPDLDRRVDPLLAKAMHPEPDARLDPTKLRTEIATILTTPHKANVVEEAAAPSPVAVQASTPLKLVEPTDPDDLESWLAVLEAKPSHLPAREAVTRIERESREAERWDRVAEVLATKAKISQAENEKIVLLRELAEIHEQRLQAPGDALDAAMDLIETISINAQVPLVDELLRLAEVTGRWTPVAKRLHAVGKRVPKLEDQLRILGRAGSILVEQGELDAAVATYEDALDLEPENLELQRAALVAYRKADRPAELATGLLTIAELESGAPRHEALLEAADILGELGEHEGALEASEHVRAEAPQSERALAASERWARELERWPVLAEVLPALAELRDDPELRREAATILRERLDDEAGAAAQYRRLVERDREDTAAAEALAELLRPKIEGDSGEAATAREGLIDALSVLADHSDEVGRRAELLAETAALLDREVDGGERAADCRERVVDSLPVDHPLAAEAVAGLIRYYKAEANHQALAELVERRAKSTALPDELRVEAYSILAELCAGPLADPLREARALEALVELEPDRGQWRDRLIERLRELGEDERAEALLRERMAAATAPDERAAMLVSMARMREQAGELDEAETQLREALELSDQSSEAWALLAEILDQRERPLEALEARIEAARTSLDTREKVRGLFAAAKTWIETLDKPERGLPLLREVAELDPHHEEATATLCELLVARGELEEAWPHAERWVAQVRAKDPDDREANAHAHALAGRCALAVHDKERARELLRQAKDFDPRNHDVARALADLELESEHWDAALKAYQGLALQSGKEGEPRAQAEIYLRMGQARRGMSEAGKAAQMVERALEIDPAYVDAARFLVELCAELPARKVEAQRRLIEVLQAELEALPEADERRAEREQELLDLRLALATTLADELNRPEEAVEQMRAVIERRPDDLALLHRALDLFSNAERWHHAVAVLDRLAKLQDHGPIQAKYRYAAASLIRAHELDPSGEQLRARLIAVLDADPLHDKAFALVVETLRERGDANALSKVLRSRLKALPEDAEAEVRVELLDEIAELYARALDDKRTAIAAFEQAAALAKAAGVGDEAALEDRRNRIISLSVQVGDDALDKGIEQVQAMIRDNPLDYDSYHRLVELYLAGKQRDAAITVSRTLRFLKQADEAELELADEISMENYAPPRGSVTRKQWREILMSPLSNPRLSDLYGMLWPVMAIREGKTHAGLELDRSTREPVNLQANGVARWLAYMAQILDMPAPDLFLMKGEPGGFTATALGDGKGVYATLLAGDDTFSKQPDAAVGFRVGRALARVHPHLLAAALLPSSSSLRDVIYGAVALTHPKVAIPKELRDPARAWGEAIKKLLPPSRLDDLRKAVTKVIESGGADTKNWLRGCEMTAVRTGFLTADNIDIAARVILQAGAGGVVEGKALIKELIAFSVSGPYQELRRSLKLGR